jgi:NADPH-dependent ferric siderophore reductase
MTTEQPTPSPTPAPSGDRPRRRPNPRRIDVLRIVPLSPHMVRITFTGPELHSFGWSGPAAHLKLIVPEGGSHEAAMPLPDGPRSPTMRTYTPRRFDASTAQLDIDFVLHDHGPAGRWATRARVGDQLVVMGPAPGYEVDAGAAWFVLAGDDTALPAIETILAELPAHVQAQVLVEVVGQNEARELHSAATFDVQWLPRGHDPQRAGEALEAALRTVTLPTTGAGRIYVGCEAAAMRRIREWLIKERGIDRATMVTRGYWKLGSANHPDRDFGDEPV